ncbi:hypothetical protein VNO77_00478 [Canavalia gladiata]|uniref:Phytocyanin domain-containing protein n=1 Tax=Canavalia gladiata TaxID=3824 RepID=A0AAN9MPH1_CANGL
MAVKTHLGFFIFTMVGCIIMVPVSSKTTHIVGDSFGWSLPNNPEFYKEWAKNRNFVVGDLLIFQYHPGLNTVVQVNKEDYDNCSIKNTINSYVRGNSSFTLDKPGDYFFISSVGKHCEAGEKLSITVSQGKLQSSSI